MLFECVGKNNEVIEENKDLFQVEVPMLFSINEFGLRV